MSTREERNDNTDAIKKILIVCVCVCVCEFDAVTKANWWKPGLKSNYPVDS